MTDLIILKILLDKELYLKYNKYINIYYYKDNNILLYKLINIIINIYKEYEDKQQITLDEVEASYLTAYPALRQDEKESLEGILLRLSEVEISSEICEKAAQSHFEQVLASRIALKALEVSEGKDTYENLSQLVLDSPRAIVEVDEEDLFVTDDLERLYDHQVKKHGLRWRLRALNEMLGSLRVGDFGFVFARPETGKTTFLASEATFMASQADSPVLWINNEEQGEKVQLRCYQAALGFTLPELFRDINGNKKKYTDVTKNNIKIKDGANISRTEVERICEQIKPSLIIFDQIDKITGFEADREDLKLGSIYQWGREIAKKYAPVIGVCQADGSGEGQKWLTMANVSNAKTSKQAEADWIVGIGKTNVLGEENVRYLHASKNKLTGDEDSIPEMRHGHTTVLILPEVARYRDLKE